MNPRFVVVWSFVIACSIIVSAQEQPKPAGKEACWSCHASERKAVAGTPHEAGASCEGCHGGGDAHLRSTGDPKSIFSFRRASAAEVREKCGHCHSNPTMARHAAGDVSCLACHSSHHYLKKKYLLGPADDPLQHPASIPSSAPMGSLG